MTSYADVFFISSFVDSLFIAFPIFLIEPPDFFLLTCRLSNVKNQLFILVSCRSHRLSPTSHSSIGLSTSASDRNALGRVPRRRPHRCGPWHKANRRAHYHAWLQAHLHPPSILAPSMSRPREGALPPPRPQLHGCL